MQALSSIRQIDYTVLYTRDLPAMRHFYETVMGFPLLRELSGNWIEFRVGATTLALTPHGMRFDDEPPPPGALSVQLAFRVAPQLVAACAEELAASGVELIAPLTDHDFGHRTIFLRDPDGNVIEIYAEL